jgi:PAS domain S-box-containing protein
MPAGANMIPLQRSSSPLESAADSVMMRTVEGIINFWNHAAEDLYGWKKEEAIGKVSHDLLKTQFPKPLEEIDSELVTRGRWEGKLIHATRNGGRVVVESRWILDPSQQPGAVVEINAPYDRREAQPDAHMFGGRARTEVPFGTLGAKSRRANSVRVLTYAGLLAIAIGWILYVLFAPDLIKDMYHGRAALPFLNQVMEGRGSTPIQSYHQTADRLMLLGTFWLVTSYLTLLFLLKRPIGAVLAIFSFLVTSFLVFCFVELAPSLIKRFGLDAIGYYAYKVNYLDDDVLIYREKPFNKVTYENYRNENYSALYGIEVPPVHFEWITDENGFRNSQAREHSDIIAIGDSYLEWGNTEADTFVNRLTNKLPGLTTANLGKSGYGPPQYLEVLKRYGVKYQPKYALLAFFEGNDVQDTKSYFSWKKGQTEKLPYFPYRMAQLSFIQRYLLALNSQATFIRATLSYWVELALNRMAQRQGYAYDIHPDLALIDVGDGKTHKMKFVEHLDTRSPKEMLASQEWQQLKTVLADVRAASEKNGIALVVIYIPAAAHVYAQYSTTQSGENWLTIRDQQIQAKTNTEEAMSQMAQDLDLDLISLSPVLEEAASRGKMLYYSLDPHWNPEGTELAANYVADILKSRNISASAQASN